MVQVTIVVPVIRPGLGRETFEAIIKYCNFPYTLKAIIHPNLEELIKWSRHQGIEVIQDLFIPIVRAKKASVELCDTEYLLLFNSNIRPQTEMKPLLDVLEKYPPIGVCAAGITGSPLRRLSGKNIIIKDGKVTYAPLTELNFRDGFIVCDYVNDAATMYRMDIFKDVMFDTTFASDYAHLDFFMQLKETPWEAVYSNEILVEEVEYTDPVWYHSIRRCGTNLSKARFTKKWDVTAW